jgi:hypothetical protein
MPKVSTPDLAVRPYLTPGQAARVFGHGAHYWRRLFDAGTVRGFTHGRRRYVEAESARAHFESLTAARATATDPLRASRQRYLDKLNSDPRIIELRARSSCGP